ncbi:MAG: DUF1972 domain-containing protein [Lachnospiraceae bacterium]|nr:DUF1972 domain-containing protein [Lachnospiraceae bacterium]
MQHVFVIGAKGFVYGGYESFLNKLTEYHQNNKDIQYHIACKANGNGRTDESKLKGVEILSETEYVYHNAHCFKIQSPDFGSAQALFYDIKSLQYVCNYIKEHNIEKPIIYILSSRIGFAMGHYAKIIHKLGGQYWHNPDGLEFKRGKYSYPVRCYWKYSERLMVKNADLEICDSKNIEKYIQSEYEKYKPKTTYIAYGADIEPSKLADNDPKYVDWLKKFGLREQNYYLSVGRFVPENNFETMIREFMMSKTEKDFAIITTNYPKFLARLDKKLHFSGDKRIKFVGTVYDQELLKKIRENAYAYFHGHSVGGTNPSLLEALGSTKLNILFNIGFNSEVAEDAALYWDLENGSLENTITKSDGMSFSAIESYGEKAKQRIKDNYSWHYIADNYVATIINDFDGE